MLFAALGLLLTLYLPGAMLFRAPVLARERRAALAADERAYWALVLSVAWSSIIGFGLAAAHRYSIGHLLAANAGLVVVVALAWRGRLRLGASAPRPTLGVLVPMALVALCACLFFPPAEYIIGGKDPGVYINEGIQIGQRGALITRDPLIAAVPVAFRDLFYPSHGNDAYYSVRFMGFFIMDPDQGTVVGQFPHLFPLWVAIGYGLYGLTGALHVLGACAALGVLGLFFVGARLTGRTAAAGGAALLAVSVVQVWFARYPNAEMLTQALLLGGLLAFARAHVDEDVFFAPVAALLLGLLLFARFDAVLAYLGVSLALAALVVAGRPLHALFLGPFAAMLAAGVTYLLLVMRPYAARPVAFFENLGAWTIGGTLLVALAGLAVLLGLTRTAAARTRLVTWAPRVLAAVMLAAAVYAFFFRVPGGRLAVHDANSLRMFAWYLHPAGIGAALIGLSLVAWRRFWTDPAFVLVACVYALFVFYKVQIVPEHFWLARRFVPMIMPSALLFAAAAVLTGFTGPLMPGGRVGVFRATGDRVARTAIRLVLLVLLASGLIASTRPILAHVEYEGIIPRIEALARRFGDRDLLVIESRNASDVHVLALPLAYIYARQVLVLTNPKPNKAVFADFLDWARPRYDHVYFLGGGGTDLLSRRFGVSVVASERFQIPEYESLQNAYPTHVRYKEFDFGIYRFTPPAATATWFSLDVGTRDDLHVVRFHAKEQNALRTYRWTRNLSYVSVVGIQPEASLLTMVMENGGRPSTAPPATVEVFLNDRRLGQATVGADAQPYSFAIPRDLAAAAAASDETALLKLVSSTWNPRATLGVDDNRDLGVMVDRIDLR